MKAPPERADLAEVNSYLGHMEVQELERMLERVPAMSRQVFNLFAIDGFPHAEIAGMLGISEGTSKWHVSNARSILQQALARAVAVDRARTPSP